MFLRAFAHDGLKGAHPLIQRGNGRADRPIAGENHSIGTERIEDVVDDRRQIGRSPAPDLAVFTRPETLQTTFGRCARAAMSRRQCVRSGAVPSLVWTGALPQWSRMNWVLGQASINLAASGNSASLMQRSKRRPRLAESPDAADESRIEAIAGRRGIGVQDLADAFDEWAVAELSDISIEIIGGRPAGNDAGNHSGIGLLACGDNEIGFCLLLGRIDIHFHVNGFDDVQASRGSLVIR